MSKEPDGWMIVTVAGGGLNTTPYTIPNKNGLAVMAHMRNNLKRKTDFVVDGKIVYGYIYHKETLEGTTDHNRGQVHRFAEWMTISRKRIGNTVYQYFVPVYKGRTGYFNIRKNDLK